MADEKMTARDALAEWLDTNSDDYSPEVGAANELVEHLLYRGFRITPTSEPQAPDLHGPTLEVAPFAWTLDGAEVDADSFTTDPEAASVWRLEGETVIALYTHPPQAPDARAAIKVLADMVTLAEFSDLETAPSWRPTIAEAHALIANARALIASTKPESPSAPTTSDRDDSRELGA